MRARYLIPLAVLITPNLHEAARLLDAPAAQNVAEMEAQARALQTRFGAHAVLIKGGHGTGIDAVDLMLAEDGLALALSRPRLAVTNTHGTGCTLSAAIAALLATGVPMFEAVRRAKDFVWQALEAGQHLEIGTGNGPVDHVFAIRKNQPPA